MKTTLIAILLIYSTYTEAKPHKAIEPTYSVFIRITCHGHIIKNIYTTPNRPGVIITDHNPANLDPKLEVIFLKARHVGLQYDTEDCNI